MDEAIGRFMMEEYRNEIYQKLENVENVNKKINFQHFMEIVENKY